MTLLKAYTYFPMIIPSWPFDDSIAGNLFSQFSVGATALLVCILNLNITWMIILVFLYGIIEESFVLLGIYTQYWYQTWMTMVLLMFFFFFAKKLYHHILKQMKPLVLYLLIISGMFPTFIATLVWALILSGYQNYSLSFPPDADISRSLLIMLHFYILTVSMMYIYYSRLVWPWRAIIVLCYYGLNYLASNYHLMYFYNGWWYLIYTTVTLTWNYFCILVLDRMYNSLYRNI